MYSLRHRRGQQRCLQSSGKLRLVRLAGKHGKYLVDMARRAGQQVVIGQNPAVGNWQLSEHSALTLGNSAKPASIRTSSAGNHVSVPHVHTRDKIAARLIVSGTADLHRCNRLPLFRQPFSDRYVPGERYRNVHLVRFVEKGRSFADTYQLVGWRSIRLGWEYSYYPFFHIHFRIIFAAFGDRSIFNNPHVGIVYSSTYLYQPQRDHFLQYGTKSGEGLGKPRFQHKSVAYDQSVGGHPVCSPAGALYLADVAPYLGVQRVGWFHLLPA